ncbi:pentapeptide repeat-containing protein [Lentzea sp. NPDC051213]|uniref:pentapeptide repeat-containing protein n=1 Tax=Lentzea sp. NPDC051213 TaxID=3364126 RepID=UPI0037A5D626
MGGLLRCLRRKAGQPMRNPSHAVGDSGRVGVAQESSGYPVLSTRAIRWAAIVLTVVGVGMATWLLLAFGGGTDADKARLEAIKTAGTIVVGTGGAAALWLAARRLQTSEMAVRQKQDDQKLQLEVAAQNEHDAAERRMTELYTKAVEQLGSDNAPVRLGGMYALERLAQSVPKQQQTIVNVLCAYLRMPYLPPQEDDDQPDGERRHQERQVRLTAQRILADHLGPGDAPERLADTYWERIDLDLTGATLLDLDFGRCRIRTARFDGAEFCGRTSFREAKFDGNVSFDDARFNGDASLGGAKFGAEALFRGAEFAENAWFNGAGFGGTVGFNKTKFHDNAWFREAKFDEAASFDWAEFSAEAWFNGAVFVKSSGFNKTKFGPNTWFRESKFGGDAVFDRAEFGSTAMFGGAEFSGYAGFNEARFAGASWFDRVCFSEGVWYREAGFDGAAMFDGAEFSRTAWFDRTCFGGGAWFRETEFGRAAVFETARVRLDVDLSEESVWPAGVRQAEPGTDEEARLPGRDGRWGCLRS